MDSTLKTAKGTRDYIGESKALLDSIIETTERIYKSRGAIGLDTPMFEMKSILMNKYGEDTKLIYDLADQGGEICALRYDLTVPFARYLAQTKTVKIKRYQTGKVFRRDQPAMNKGRYREFFQSDFDIVGEYAWMTADVEVVSAGCEILRYFAKLMGDRKFVMRLNHKKLVDSIMEVAGVPLSLQRTLGSSIDKLDKLSWEEVAQEMVAKGATEEMVLSLKQFIGIKGPLSILAQLRETPLLKTESGAAALADLERLYELLIIYSVDDDVVLDLSLVRGLDYYTGILVEGGYVDCPGSVIAGGRYDELVSGLVEGNLGPNKTPQAIKCVGLSLGVNRIFGLLDLPSKSSTTEVLVCSVGPNMLEERIRLCAYLRSHNIATEYFMGTANSFTRHAEYADAQGIRLLVLIGQKELEQGQCQLLWGDKSNRQKQTILRSHIIESLTSLLNSTPSTTST
ncbi:histidyl-tRNA synthetase [Nematocida homosporus]|uniref:histidyl-tRNA synthetase n=1 Tax=Nematocida homosporus TaxID=1912981 RepID=UPI00221E405B|nr:histidyl-tRNA synthetase [Nematocida homosporus]KAI5185875.1 histidyl-tRNA synthetase [Nematocida homosporus]